jgi:transcription elongation factor Elf1
MKCPKCLEKEVDSDMEKARDSSILLCRSCGHTTSAMSRAEMAKEIESQGKRIGELETAKKEKDEKKKEKESAW